MSNAWSRPCVNMQTCGICGELMNFENLGLHDASPARMAALEALTKKCPDCGFESRPRCVLELKRFYYKCGRCGKGWAASRD